MVKKELNLSVVCAVVVPVFVRQGVFAYVFVDEFYMKVTKAMFCCYFHN